MRLSQYRKGVGGESCSDGATVDVNAVGVSSERMVVKLKSDGPTRKRGTKVGCA